MKGKIQLSADALIALRRKRGLSQFDMAMECKERRLNIALSTIKRVESGHAILLRTARNIATFFECSMESLTTVEGSSEQSSEHSVEPSPLNPHQPHNPSTTSHTPDSLKQFILTKINTFNTRVCDIACCAAVIGDHFERAPLEHLAGNIDFEINTLVQHSLVVPQTKGYYRFSHSLIHQTLYEDLAEPKRSQFHRLLANWYKNGDRNAYAYHLNHSGSLLAMPAYSYAAEGVGEGSQYADVLTLADNALALNQNENARFPLLLYKGILLRHLNLPEKSIDFLLQAQQCSQHTAHSLACQLELIVSYHVAQHPEYARRSMTDAKILARQVFNKDLLSKMSFIEDQLFHEQNSHPLFQGEKWLDQIEQSPELTQRLLVAYETHISVRQPPLNSLAVNQTEGIASVDVGVLFSQTGHLQELELGVIQTTLMAIDEINQSGGLLGQQINPVLADGASCEQSFERAAATLLTQTKPCVIFGCSTSSSRKMVEPLLKRHRSLLMYPFQYEGMESSPHITYVGPAPNQQALPAIEWLVRQNRKRFFLIGSNYIYPQVTNKLIKDQLSHWQITLCGEQYTPLAGTDFSLVIDEIKQQKPDAIILTLVGLASNRAFYQQFYEAGLKTPNITVMSLVLSENDLSDIPIEYVSGYYSLFSYFQNIQAPTNTDFVRHFKQRHGADARIGGYMESAYVAVYLWAKAVLKAGSFDVEPVKKALKGSSHYGPGGLAYVDEKNNHAWRQVRVAKVQDDGMFHVMWSSDRPIAPKPFPPTSNTSEMEQFVKQLRHHWDGKWEKQV